MTGKWVRYRKPRSAIYREGEVVRWSYSRSGQMLLQVQIQKIGGQRIRDPHHVRLNPKNVEVLEDDWQPWRDVK